MPTFQVSKADMSILKKAAEAQASLAALLTRATLSFDGQNADLQLNMEEAEMFRSALTERLAKIGFDAGYALTPKGRAIEDLIDRLFHKGD